MMKEDRVCFVVPFRVRFSPNGWFPWMRGALPVFWHHWSEWTDIRRIPLNRRTRIVWDWWINRPATLPLPIESRAVEWWLSRLLRAEHWDWDRSFVAAQLGRAVGDCEGVPLTGTSMREPLREFFTPDAFGTFLAEELSHPHEDHWFVPPVSCVHTRLSTVEEGRRGWISFAGAPGSRVEVEWSGIRLHMFRFGDGMLTLSLRSRNGLSVEELSRMLGRWCRKPEEMRFGFEGDAILPWSEGKQTSFRALVEGLLAPSELYDVSQPDRTQWYFGWGDDPHASEHTHRIEFPLLSRLPSFVLREGEVSTVADERVEAEGPVVVASLANGDDPAFEGDRTPCRETAYLRGLGVFLLGVFRRIKLTEVAELLATPRGTSHLSSAQFLQQLAFQVALAHDRFFALSPVFGGWTQRLWGELDRAWSLSEMQERIVPTVRAHREDYFRGRSLRLIARITSAFWFLFRWILIPVLWVSAAALVVASGFVWIAGLLTLSLLSTAAVVVARFLHRRIAPSVSSSGEAPAKRRLRIDWVLVAALAEAGAIGLLVAFQPALRDPFIKLFLLILGSLVAVAGIAFFALRKRWSRESLARFYQTQTVPIVAFVLVMVTVLSLPAVIGYLVADSGEGLGRLKFQQFWDALTSAKTGGPEDGPGE